MTALDATHALDLSRIVLARLEAEHADPELTETQRLRVRFYERKAEQSREAARS